MTSTELSSLHRRLTSEWKKGDLSACSTTLDQVRLLLSRSMSFLPVDGDAVGDKRRKELLLSRDVLEIGALHSVKQRDEAAFERFVAQLKTYYGDYSSVLPESAYQ